MARKDSLKNERQNSFNAKRLKHNRILTAVIAEKESKTAYFKYTFVKKNIHHEEYFIIKRNVSCKEEIHPTKKNPA
jgi:hypothetical protein